MPDYRNHVELIGQVDREPELKRLESGKAVCTLSILVKYGKHNAFEGWHRVVVWEEDAEAWSGAEIGTWAHVFGYLKTRAWTDATGRKQYMTEVVAREIERLEDGASCEPPAGAEPPALEVDEDGNELPF